MKELKAIAPWLINKSQENNHLQISCSGNSHPSKFKLAKSPLRKEFPPSEFPSVDIWYIETWRGLIDFRLHKQM